LQSSAAPPYAALLVVSQVALAHRLRRPLRGGGEFVAAGALHLYGPERVLALIRDQGYRVRRLHRPDQRPAAPLGRRGMRVPAKE